MNSNAAARRSKPGLSLHQKQIRFFTGLSVLACAAFATAVFWWLSRTSLIPH